MQETTKQFDCVQMKRKAQEQINRETKGMTPEQLVNYFQEAAERYRASHQAKNGKGNFKALFESLELEQERRGNL